MFDSGERRKGGDRRGMAEGGERPYLTQSGWVSLDRRKTPDRRRFDFSNLRPGEVEEIEIKPL